MVPSTSTSSSVRTSALNGRQAGPSSDASSVPELELPKCTVPDREKLQTALSTHFRSQLPFLRIAGESGFDSSEQLVKSAVASLNRLNGWYEQLGTLVEAVCAAGIQHHWTGNVSEAARANAVQTVLRRMLAGIEVPLPKPSGFDADFLALPAELQLDVARKELRDRCDALASAVLHTIVQLEEQRVVGRLRMTSETTCEFYFYRRVIIQEQKRTGVTTTHTSVTPHPLFGNRHVVYHEQDLEQTELHRRDLHGRYEHHVMNAALLSPDRVKAVIPREYSGLLNALPDWLSPDVRVLEGDLILERQFEQELSSEREVGEPVVIQERRTVIQSWLSCPAIVFGDYVLAGWSDREIKHEEQRRGEEQHREFLKQSASEAHTARTLALGLSLLALVIMLIGRMHPLLPLVAMLVNVCAIGAAVSSLHKFLEARDESDLLTVITGSLSLGLLMFAPPLLVYSVLYVSLKVFAISVVFGWIGAVSARQQFFRMIRG